jgi:glycosyltransferase involved in cell wall biosynthesis
MREAPGSSRQETTNPLSFVVSLLFAGSEAPARLGGDAYSYYFAFAPLEPLLRRYGAVAPLTKAESRLDYALWRRQQAGEAPVHVSFLPLQYTYLSSRAPNIAFPFWEFPDIPQGWGLANPRDDWKRIAERLDLILCASNFTRDAFLRAGIKVPVRLVPIPVRPENLAMPAWQGGRRFSLPCACYPLGVPVSNSSDAAAAANAPAGPGLVVRTRLAYQAKLRPFLPSLARMAISRALRIVKFFRDSLRTDKHLEPATLLDLSGIVYTSVFNVEDPRKNWQDMLSAFLLALADNDDASLVIKLVSPAERIAQDVGRVEECYRRLGVRHRCKLQLVAGYLTDSEMRELIRGSTYYVNTSHAEGACLPLQEFLASGRPGIAPRHSALSDYFDDEVGFVVESHPEPAPWPHLPEQGYVTTRHRLVWQSLFDQFRTSYAIAATDVPKYRALARRARQRMQQFAGAERVAACLHEALRTILPGIPRPEPAESLRQSA